MNLKGDATSQGDVLNSNSDLINPILPTETIVTRSGRVVRSRTIYGDLASTEEIKPMGFLVRNDMSIKQALSGSRPEEAKEAIISEIQNMIDYGVGYYVKFEEIPKSKRRNILRSFMFIKEKFKPNMVHDKTKARIVGDGSRQGTHTYDIISSTTVDLCCVFLLFAIASYLRSDIICYDIKGAFLNAQFGSEDEEIYLRIDSDIVQFWKKLDPSVEEYLDVHGCLYMKLDKFIYGLKQSPAKFQDHLKITLLSAGYSQLENDNCLFLKKDDESVSILSTHVDDIMQVSNREDWKDELKKILVSVYNFIDVQRPGTAYLGMDIRRGSDKQDIYVSQPKLTTDIISFYLDEKSKSVSTPSRADIMDFECKRVSDEDQELINQKDFLSLIMKLMYLARLTRPDILFSVTYLATKSQKPILRDWKNAIRIVQYLSGTPFFGIHVHCSDLTMYAHCDASYGAHADGKGHTGFIISLGESLSYIHARSSKQKVGSTSSTDAEIIAAKSCCQMIQWIRNILREVDLETTKPTIFFKTTKVQLSFIHQINHLTEELSIC
jgi:hypothetical protein